jgi:cobyrinic acid a,c-diamide synthase
MHSIPAFLVGGTTSGSGKTTITLGILAALRQRGFKVQPFKCGPDFIDPTLHTMVTGNTSRNLDLQMAGSSFCRNTFFRHIEGMDVAVIEGVMGLYDGGQASSAALAIELSLPVILVIDVRSAAESVAAVLKGFELYNQEVQISGVIFNRVGSTRHQELIRDAVKKHCTTEILGFFPRDNEFTIPERHLGLHMGDESPLNEEQVKTLAMAIEEYIDIDHLLQLNMVKNSGKLKKATNRQIDQRVTLAVARDQAFCFYYQDNFDLFEQAGIDLVFFSPLHDTLLPEDMNGIYIGGGYPELYADKLSGNKEMLRQIKAWVDLGGPLYCECGGFMYMATELIDLQNNHFSMAGVFPATIVMKDRLSRLGYREATIIQDCMFGECGERLFGHEFHYSTIQEIESTVPTIFELQDGSKEGYTVKNALGGYLHLHFGQSEKNVEYFYNFLLKGRGKNRWSLYNKSNLCK